MRDGMISSRQFAAMRYVAGDIRSGTTARQMEIRCSNREESTGCQDFRVRIARYYRSFAVVRRVGPINTPISDVKKSRPRINHEEHAFRRTGNISVRGSAP